MRSERAWFKSFYLSYLFCIHFILLFLFHLIVFIVFVSLFIFPEIRIWQSSTTEFHSNSFILGHCMQLNNLQYRQYNSIFLSMVV